MLVLEKTKPLYQHDCNDCIYLGADEIRDYYFCKERSISDSGTLIIRLGNNPSDYFSMPMNVVISELSKGTLEEDNVFAMCYQRYLKFVENSMNK